MKELINNLYSKSVSLANTSWSAWVLLAVAFADASFIPLPATTLFLILIIMDITKSVKYILAVASGTLAGAVIGYLVGHFAWIDVNGEESGLGHFVLSSVPGFSEAAYNKLHVMYSRWDYKILFLAALTPIPYGVFAISSGIFEINFSIFCFATLISQTIKFVVLTIVTLKIGPEIKRFTILKLKPPIIIASAVVLLVLILWIV